MTNGTKAPSCPVSFSQEPTNPRGTAPIRLPSIPIATDLPSLIRSVNIMRDILRSLTTSKTVNNYYFGNVTPPKQYGDKSYIMSDYDSDWYQTGIENTDGVIYNKSGNKLDTKQKAYIRRMNAVKFRNNARDNDQSFDWRYVKQPDAEETGDPMFEEDFFERVVNVHWKKEEPPGYTIQWFWSIKVDFIWTSVEFGCDPWTPQPENARGITGPGSHCWWDAQPVKRFLPADPPGFVVFGKPSLSPEHYEAPDHLIGSLLAGLPDTNVLGESLTVPVMGKPFITPLDCWGSFPYPPNPIGGHWSGFGRMDGTGPNTEMGKVTVDASGISAKLNGKPLKKISTEINATKVSGGGFVVVKFAPPDK